MPAVNAFTVVKINHVLTNILGAIHDIILATAIYDKTKRSFNFYISDTKSAEN